MWCEIVKYKLQGCNSGLCPHTLPTYHFFCFGSVATAVSTRSSCGQSRHCQSTFYEAQAAADQHLLAVTK